jgi:hypothetical protein
MEACERSKKKAIGNDRHVGESEWKDGTKGRKKAVTRKQERKRKEKEEEVEKKNREYL